MTGDSAGGLSTLYNGDTIAGLIRASSKQPTVNIVIVPDSGYFLTNDVYDVWTQQTRWRYEYMNMSAALTQCVQTKSSEDAYTCAFVQEYVAYIQQPVMLVSSQYDPAIMLFSFGENGTNVTNVNTYGAVLMKSMYNNVGANAHNGGFISGCYVHSGQW